MKWNLRMVAAQRDVWKASELQRMLAEAGLVISAGKMSHLWSGRPLTVRLDDLDIICEVLDCTPAELLVPEKSAGRQETTAVEETPRQVVGGTPVMHRRRPGRSGPPL
ncbi:helix-turn-helix transcriptional regulator [Streptomyces sp. PSKA30]|uniref:helix-turn-helix domain-containing protein n=1 Tax=Streptomyces sp. PSKA30 TaxID=2874597 RepID=UPI001CD0AB75|nr:helix-turn-helix transcriptional regulator [Streptomyces sp. PSKA30]MBZ9641982.1 helix-turn-helix transcriptional regulator [Streptomyces sp. PSKA30]